MVFRNGKNRHKIVIGKDTRLSGYMLESALTAGITSMGVDVYLVGPIPTPGIAHLTRSFACDAGIMISASHNPATDNGIKFFSHQGTKLPDEVEARMEGFILGEDLATDHIQGERIGKAFRIGDASGRYIEFVKASIGNSDLSGYKVVLDCANGAAYKIAPDIFSELGAEVHVINNRPDGLNINKGCGAMHPEVVRDEVLKRKADIGITLDGDGDRAILVDEEGNIIDGDFIMTIAALDLLKEGALAKKTLVVTEYSNLSVDEAVKAAGGKVVRTENGDRHVVDEMLQKGYNLGGEQSGHIIFGDYNMTGDGMISALQILDIMRKDKKSLSALAKCLVKYPQVIKNVHVKEKRPLEKITGFVEELSSVDKDLHGKGRTLIRYSGTQDVLRIMIEGKDKDRIHGMAGRLAAIAQKELGRGGD
jgi:phosphoglucosamine mutase